MKKNKHLESDILNIVEYRVLEPPLESVVVNGVFVERPEQSSNYNIEVILHFENEQQNSWLNGTVVVESKNQDIAEDEVKLLVIDYLKNIK